MRAVSLLAQLNQLRLPTGPCTVNPLHYTADMSVGDWAAVAPDDGETKPTCRNRLKAAAGRRGLSIVFQRTKDTSVVFHLEQVEE